MLEPPVGVSSSVATTCSESRKLVLPGPASLPLLGFGGSEMLPVAGPVRSMAKSWATAASPKLPQRDGGAQAVMPAMLGASQARTYRVCAPSVSVFRVELGTTAQNE